VIKLDGFVPVSEMPSLQIRDLPVAVYNHLLRRAQLHRRSLAQQAIVDLTSVAQADRVECRRAALAHWRARLVRPSIVLEQSPEDMIRADRDR
jgi:hypothetical protein